MIDIQLRPYQERDIQKMIRLRRVYNCNEPGLGKTLESLYTCNALGYENILVLSPKVGYGTWEHEGQKWFDYQSIMYTGTQKQRAKLWEQYKEEHKNIFISHTALLPEIQNLRNRWDCIIVDEIHRLGLLNHKTKAHKLMRKLKSDGMILLTGTPIRRNPSDLYAPLNLIDPKVFTSYWNFRNTWCITYQDSFGIEIDPQPKNPVKFAEMLRYYLVRNLKNKVLPDLPPKIRRTVPIYLAESDKKIYDTLSSEWMYLFKNGNFIITPNVLALRTRLRQFLVSPKLLGGENWGIGFETAYNLMEEEYDYNTSVMVVIPFKAGITYFKEYLMEKDPTIRTYEIHGDIRETATAVANRFMTDLYKKKVLLITVQAGVSFNAHSASKAIFLGYSWSAGENTQAEDRLHRIGQTSTVRIDYILHKHTIDEDLMTALDEKQFSSNWCLRTEDVIKKLYEKY